MWITYNAEFAKPGVRVASYPNHKGEVLEGTIKSRYGLYGEEYIEVEYSGGQVCQLLTQTGRYSTKMDTSLDAGMIWKE